VNLLLDTNALLWWLENSPKLGRRAKSKIANEDVWTSSASVWEIAIKLGARRLRLSFPLTRMPSAIEAEGFSPMPVTIEHAIEVSELPRHHDDPFDRILIAQARLEGMTIVTSDFLFDAYKVPLLDASE
jgi:PIN domain nuclease of toxin-antitoxin system